MSGSLTGADSLDVQARRLESIGLLLALVTLGLVVNAGVQSLGSGAGSFGTDLDYKQVLRVVTHLGGSYVNALLLAAAYVALWVGTGTSKLGRAGHLAAWVIFPVGLAVAGLALGNAADALVSNTGSYAVGEFSIGSPSLVLRLSGAVPVLFGAALAGYVSWCAFCALPLAQAAEASEASEVVDDSAEDTRGSDPDETST